MQFFGKRAASRAVIAATMVALAACSDSRQSNLPTESETSLAVGLESTAPPHHQVAQLVALALRDAPVRHALHRATATSPVKEGKLHLTVFLRGEGAPLLQAMARAGSLSEAEIFRLLDQTRPLEIYVPVLEHRALWTGGSDVIVGTLLEEEEIPFGVALNGQRVMIPEKNPPSTPVIVSVVPAESFDAAGQPYARHLQGPVASSGLVAPQGPKFLLADEGVQGLYATFIKMSDTHEPLLKGSPEIELHAFGKRSNTDGSAKMLQCSGEHANNQGAYQPGLRDQSYVFDQNDASWTGTVKILNAAQLDTAQTAEYDGFNVSIWEDDDEACKVKQKDSKDYFKNAVSATASVVAGWVALTAKGSPDWKTVAATFGSASTDLYDLVVGGDDYVGVFVRKEETSYVNDYPDANHILYRGTNYYGRGMLEVK